jgi:hypothetical protein
MKADKNIAFLYILCIRPQKEGPLGKDTQGLDFGLSLASTHLRKFDNFA